MRAGYRTLPSMAALADADLAVVTHPVRDGGCRREVDWKRPPPTVRIPGAGDDAGDPLLLWVLGDSVAVPVGMPAEEGWWYRALGALAEGRPVDAVRLAVPGSDYCALVEQAEAGLERGRAPDGVVVSVFADDLDRHERFSVAGRDVLLPSAAPAWLRPAVTRSYVVNLTWWALEPGRRSVRARGLTAGTPERFLAAMRRLVGLLPEGTPVLFVLQAPSGLSGCPARPAPDEACASLPADLAVMRAQLVGAGWPVVDLEPLLRGGAVPPLERDRVYVAEGKLEIPLHVAPEGQPLVADEIVRQARALGWAPARAHGTDAGGR